MTAGRRSFTAKQRRAVEIVTGRSGEADHVIPYSKGGDTTVENCQLIDGTTNKQKGSFMYRPRKWQVEFQSAWDARKGKSFLLIVIPGGGKTMAALEACRRWMAAASDRRIIVVVPTTNLREQWREEAVQFGIQLQTKEFGTNFKHGFQGGVATYHYVANNADQFRALCSRSPTMVVFDEIHHCGDEAHFGKGITEAFELAKERLLLSGTPWKSDGTAIPYVHYDGNGFAVGDYSYDYPRALNEEVVRFLVFDYSRGTVTNNETGEIRTLSSESLEGESSPLLNRLLDSGGQFVEEQIRQAHAKLLELRASNPDAGAMAACVDQAHAIRVKEVIERVTGCSPSIIVSDSDIENDTVRKFRTSRTEWLVAVRKVSEGTDIKRLQVLCYLTNTISDLFFRQIVGRVSRYRGGDDTQAHVYLPADPRLIRCAQNIENAQVQAIREQFEVDSRERPEGSDSGLLVDSYSTAHDGTDLVMIGGEAVAIEQAREIERLSNLVGVPMQKVRALMSAIGATLPTVAVEPRTVSKEEEMDSLRKECHKKAGWLSRLLQCHPKEVHLKFSKRQEDMTESELRQKLSWMMAEGKRVLAEGRGNV